MEVPSDYAVIWKKRYDELVGHGVPAETAKQLASELAAAAVLAAAREKGVLAPIDAPAPAAAAPTLRMAKFDGYGLVVMGVPSVILALFSRSAVGFIVGVVVAACGCLELDGLRRYSGRLDGARSRLMGSQLLLIAMAWCYAGWSLLHPEPLSPDIMEMIRETGDESPDLLRLANNLRYVVAAAICVVTLLYQGGLALYYWSKTRRSA